MATLTVTTFSTLDGVMQGPGAPAEDRSGGFTQGGWGVPHFEEHLGRLMGGIFERAEAFLLGRTTYEIFAGHWPRVTDPADPIAGPLNRLPKYVASRSLTKLTWSNSHLVRDVATEVAELKQTLSGELQVHGSAGLIQTLLEKGLVDELNLIAFPVIVGNGKRLFGPGAVPTAFELKEHRVTKRGVTFGTYARKGSPEYGSFALDA